MRFVVMLCNYIAGFGCVGLLTLFVRQGVRHPYLSIAISWGAACFFTAMGKGQQGGGRGMPGPWPDGLTPSAIISLSLGALTVAAIQVIYQSNIEKRRKAGAYWSVEDGDPKQL